jgi:hypothetical protein
MPTPSCWTPTFLVESFKIQNAHCTMLIVSIYENLGMAKRDFDLALGLQNQQITSTRPNNQCWS